MPSLNWLINNEAAELSFTESLVRKTKRKRYQCQYDNKIDIVNVMFQTLKYQLDAETSWIPF